MMRRESVLGPGTGRGVRGRRRRGWNSKEGSRGWRGLFLRVSGESRE